MKKSIFILPAIILTLSFSAFAFMNWSNTGSALYNDVNASNCQATKEINAQTGSDFFYAIDSRYMKTMSKEDLIKLKSVGYFISCEDYKDITSYNTLSVTILGDNYESLKSEKGNSEWFNTAQMKLLRSADYSSNILFRAEYKEMNKITGKEKDTYSTPHITVIPEKEVKYLNGKDALIKYLRENSIAQTVIVNKDKLEPGKVSFTVSKNGTILNVKLLSTSGYPSIDETMIELIVKAPGKWEAAENLKGEKVDQTLIFSFGIVGC